MGAKENLELFFCEREGVCLVRTVLHAAGAGPHRARVVSQLVQAVELPGSPGFPWRTGAQVLCLALLRVKLYGEGGRMGDWLLFSGGPGSAASKLDNLIAKAGSSAWLEGMLGGGGADARMRLGRWFERKNSQRNRRDQPVLVFSRQTEGGLTPGDISVFVSGRPASREDLHRIERQLIGLLEETSRCHAPADPGPLSVSAQAARV